MHWSGTFRECHSDANDQGNWDCCSEYRIWIHTGISFNRASFSKFYSFPLATAPMCWQDKRIVFTDTFQCPGGALKSHCPVLPEGNCWGTRENSPLLQEHESSLSSKMLISKASNDSPPRLARSEHGPKPSFDPWNANFHLKATVWKFMMLLMMALM